MSYYRTSAKAVTGYCIIEVMVQSDFSAYIKSCKKYVVRYAYTKLSAKAFDSCEQASRYIEKHKLFKRFPLGCRILTIPAANKVKKIA